MKLIDYGPESYDRVSFPASHYIMLGRKYPIWDCSTKTDRFHRAWRFDLWSLLFDPIDGLLRLGGWRTNAYPSYGSGLRNLWNNIMTFLTPWYRNRRRLLHNLYNRNESKLLWSDRNECTFRNREADTRYFYVHMGFLFGKMQVIRYVADGGHGENVFIKGLLAAFSGKKEDVEKIHEERITLIKHVPILTLSQCESFMDEAVLKTHRWLTWR